MENKNIKNSLLIVINHVHPSTKFMLKGKHNNSTSFLDVRLKRLYGRLVKGIHRKFAIGQDIPCYSSVQIMYKRNLVKTLIHRTKVVCFDDASKDKLCIILNFLSTSR